MLFIFYKCSKLIELMHLYSASVPKNLCYIAVVFIFTCTNSYGPVLKSFANSNLCDFCFLLFCYETDFTHDKILLLIVPLCWTCKSLPDPLLWSMLNDTITWTLAAICSHLDTHSLLCVGFYVLFVLWPLHPMFFFSTFSSLKLMLNKINE